MKKNKSLTIPIMPAKLAHAETLDIIGELEEKAIVKLTNNVNEKILSAIKNGNFATTYYIFYTNYTDVKVGKRVFDEVVKTFQSKGYECEYIPATNPDRIDQYGKIYVSWENKEEHK